MFPRMFYQIKKTYTYAHYSTETIEYSISQDAHKTFKTHKSIISFYMVVIHYTIVFFYFTLLIIHSVNIIEIQFIRVHLAFSCTYTCRVVDLLIIN